MSDPFSKNIIAEGSVDIDFEDSSSALIKISFSHDLQSEFHELEIRMGQSFIAPSIEICIKTMRLNEIAEFTISPHLSEGISKLSQFLHGDASGILKCSCSHSVDSMLKEHQQHQIIIELKDYQAANESEPIWWKLSMEEKVKFALQIKDKAGTKYAARIFKEALDLYQQAQVIIESAKQSSQSNKEHDELLNILRLNQAACHLELCDYSKVIILASEVINSSFATPSLELKARYRRARAKIAMNQLDEELNDDLKRLEESGHDVSSYREAMKALLMRNASKESEMAKRMFSNKS